MVRDKFLCQESLRYGKKVAAVMVHHIYPVSEYPELEFVSWNCISLSNHEHNKMHNRVNDLITRKGKIWQAKRKKEFDSLKERKNVIEKSKESVPELDYSKSKVEYELNMDERDI